jgi:hypothetical protein
VGNIDGAPLGFEPEPEAVGEPYFVIDHENTHLTKYGIAVLNVS